VLAGGARHPVAGLAAYALVAVLVAVRAQRIAAPGIAVIAWFMTVSWWAATPLWACMVPAVSGSWW
jgi:hypothetical protein